MFMGDDGNENLHMADANEVADDIASLYPGYLIRKVMWDAYTRQTSSTGNTYPEVSSIIRQQQANGALVMDYAGHGSETQISHENVLKITDFESFRNENLPLWVTASCDIMPFDGTKSTIGEAALLNEKGGAAGWILRHAHIEERWSQTAYHIEVEGGAGAAGVKAGPCENINIQDNTVYHAHGGFVIGSEFSGGMKNIVVRNNTFQGTDAGLRFKSAAKRGGTTENIFIDHIYMTDITGDAITFEQSLTLFVLYEETGKALQHSSIVSTIPFEEHSKHDSPSV